jgi:hypothetical protein
LEAVFLFNGIFDKIERMKNLFKTLSFLILILIIIIFINNHKIKDLESKVIEGVLYASGEGISLSIQSNLSSGKEVNLPIEISADIIPGNWQELEANTLTISVFIRKYFVFREKILVTNVKVLKDTINNKFYFQDLSIGEEKQISKAKPLSGYVVFSTTDKSVRVPLTIYK